MTATLYVNTSDNGYMDKSITQVGAVNVTLKEDTTLERPVIILENSAQVQQANYVYIDEFGRTKVKSISGGNKEDCVKRANEWVRNYKE